jgi:hypothetical protein
VKDVLKNELDWNDRNRVAAILRLATSKQISSLGFNTKPRGLNHRRGQMFAIIVSANSASHHSWIDGIIPNPA